MLNAPSIILVLGDDGVLIVPPTSAEQKPIFIPNDAPNQKTKLVACVKEYQKHRLVFLVANSSVEYRTEQIPRLGLIDKRKLLVRRLKDRFPNADLTSFKKLKNKSNHYLLIGVHNYNSTLDYIDLFPDRLPCVVPIAPVATRLIAKLSNRKQPANAWAILVFHQITGGTQHLVLQGNDLVFTRLIHHDFAKSSQGITNSLATDIKATIDYLPRLGLDDKNKLTAHVITGASEQNNQTVTTISCANLKTYTPVEVARLLSLPDPSEEQDYTTDYLFARLIERHPFGLIKLHTPKTRHKIIDNTIRRVGRRFSVFCLVMAFVMTGIKTQDLHSTLYQTRDLQSKIGEMRHELVSLQADTAQLTGPLSLLRQAVERRRLFDQDISPLWQTLNALTETIDMTFRIQRILWSIGENPAHERIEIEILLSSPEEESKSETVFAFSETVKSISKALPSYIVTSIKTPYPSQAEDTISSASTKQPSTGSVLLERRSHVER